MASSSLVVFPFHARDVRTRLDVNGAPWFCAIDVCAALELANSRDAVDRLDEDERDCVGISDAIGRIRDTTFISESGLYCLILRSQDAVTPGTTAHRFRKWVTSEVLPKLRKQGYFGQIKPSERLQAVRTSADLVSRIARSTDQCEQYFLLELVWELSRSLGIKAPDVSKLGHKPVALPGSAP